MIGHHLGQHTIFKGMDQQPVEQLPILHRHPHTIILIHMFVLQAMELSKQSSIGIKANDVVLKALVSLIGYQESGLYDKLPHQMNLNMGIQPTVRHTETSLLVTRQSLKVSECLQTLRIRPILTTV